MGDGHIKQEDLLWLDKTLAERVKPGMKVFSFNHYPINADLDNYRDYVKVLKNIPSSPTWAATTMHGNSMKPMALWALW